MDNLNGPKAVITIVNLYLEYTKEIKDIETKPYLYTSIISHIKQTTNYPKEFIEKVISCIDLSYDI